MAGVKITLSSEFGNRVHNDSTVTRDPCCVRDKVLNADIFRPLEADEVEILVKNGNTASNWNRIMVTDQFNPNCVRGCEFWGHVRIGDLREGILEHHDLKLPIGLSNSVIIDCDIGNNVVMRNIRLISYYSIGDHSILFNIDEMCTTEHAKFGVGIIKTGESEAVRVWLELANENGGRQVLPFVSMLTADAFLWTRFRDDPDLMSRLKTLTDHTVDSSQNGPGVIGERCVVKNSRIIKDVWVGPNTYIKGANKLKNLTIQSSESEATQIGEGVELVNGIVGFGSRIFYGVKAVRFVTGRCVQLKYGARLINSFLGDNSTVSCCEILNNLIFAFHEQHHNNSFLIASTVMGQSNVAASATIGSNHNSRSPDGEIIAHRGFWPGLGVSLKHNSRFASFVLLCNGRYTNELWIPFPFSLVSRDPLRDCVQVLPAYWFLHNMYAIARNNWKFKKRDKRTVKAQHIELDVLAPDTVDEMFTAIDMLLPQLGAQVATRILNLPDIMGRQEQHDLAERWLESSFSSWEQMENHRDLEKQLVLEFPSLEKSKHPVIIHRPASGIFMYRTMIYYYAVTVLSQYILHHLDKSTKSSVSLQSLMPPTDSCQPGRWWNFGGQLIHDSDCNSIIHDIKSGSLESWDAVHRRYDRLWQEYPDRKAAHAWFALQTVTGKELSTLSVQQWKQLFEKGIDHYKMIWALAFDSRQKDYRNPFRKLVYETEEEMNAVLGSLSENEFIKFLEGEVKRYSSDIESIFQRITHYA